MVRTLLVRGMLVGIVAGLLAFGFGKLVGEPQVDRAIAFEALMRKADSRESATDAHDPAGTMPGMAMQHDEAEPELVSRTIQAGIGLFTGVFVYCVAFGGLFALVFAVANGRATSLGPRGLSALLAGTGFVAVYLVPLLKYPANPPAIGEPDTIGDRTALFFIMLMISIMAMTAAAVLRRHLVARHGGWSAALIAGACYLIIVTVAMLLLPDVNEVPEHFPAVLLWQFRIASLGIQVVMWSTIGLLFGWLTERAMAHRMASGPAGRRAISF